jgi:hypothetical protein
MQLTQFTAPGQAAVVIAADDDISGELDYYTRYLQDAPGQGRWFIVQVDSGAQGGMTPCSRASVAQISGPGSPTAVVAVMPVTDALVSEGVLLFWSPLSGVLAWLNPVDWNSMQHPEIGHVGVPKVAGSPDFAVMAIRQVTLDPHGVLSFAWLTAAGLGGSLDLYPVPGSGPNQLAITVDPDITVIGGVVVIVTNAAAGGLLFFTPSSQSIGQPPTWTSAQIADETFTARPSIVAPPDGSWLGVSALATDTVYFCWQPAIGILQGGWNTEQIPAAVFGPPSAATGGRSIVIVAAGTGQTLWAYWKQTDDTGLPTGDWTAEEIPLSLPLNLEVPPSVAYVETAGPGGAFVVAIYLVQLWTYWKVIDSDGMPIGEWIPELPRRYDCAVDQMLQREAGGRADEASAQLRQLRDGTLAATPAGRWLVDLLDRHATEFAQMLDSDPDLSRSAWELIQQAEPIATSPDTAFADDMITAAQQLLRRVRLLASPSCQESVDQLAERLPGLRGQTLPAWLATMAVPARPDLPLTRRGAIRP